MNEILFCHEESHVCMRLWFLHAKRAIFGTQKSHVLRKRITQIMRFPKTHRGVFLHIVMWSWCVVVVCGDTHEVSGRPSKTKNLQRMSSGEKNIQ